MKLTDEEILALADKISIGSREYYKFGDTRMLAFARALLAAHPVADAAPHRIGTVDVAGGRVQSYTFEQTDTPDGKYALYTAPVADAAVAPVWQPIETAPKDGTEVALLFAAEVEILGQACPRVRAASWRVDWTIPYRRDNPPTHWSPLPIAPDAAPSPTVAADAAAPSGWKSGPHNFKYVTRAEFEQQYPSNNTMPAQQPAAQRAPYQWRDTGPLETGEAES